MKRIKSVFVAFLCIFITSLAANAQGLNAFQLPNGLRVFVWEDANASDVYGMVAVDVGSKDDPSEYTGLAHYLEHMMFKGTSKIGAMDWEHEKHVYELIIAKYDEKTQTTDPVRRKELDKEINMLTQTAARYSDSNEFSNLSQSIGGFGLNAGTSWDWTIFFNSFPPNEIYRWLELNSERLIDPVFRAFQPELENVYEEYNMYFDNQGRRMQELILATIFPGHPYSRSIIGLPEHLKNPQLSQLTSFYNNWYVPQNMILVLSGNVKTKEILPMIRKTFGRLETKPVGERKHFPEIALQGRKEVKAKIAPYPMVVLAFPGITSSSEEDIALEIATSILSNSDQTGLLDKLVVDGDISAASASNLSLKERGSILIETIPYYDVNQRRYESVKATEKQIWKEIKKLQDGQFDDWLVESIKNQLNRNFDLTMESNSSRAEMIMNTVFAGQDMSRLLNYKELVVSVSTEQIKAVAKKYFGANYYAILLDEGKPDKGKDLEKPEYEPITSVRDQVSEYTKAFNQMSVKYAQPAYAKFDDVIVKPMNDRSKLYYSKNTENDIFSMVIKFGVGTEKMPKLKYAAPLVNNAGIMGSMEAQEVKQTFSNLGTTCRYQVDDNYLSVVLYGYEQHLEAACRLMTRQILFPKLDEKQMNGFIGSEFQSRILEKEDNDMLADALEEYLLYKDKSEYIDRLSLEDVFYLTISNLTGEFQRATDYEAEIHYTGALPIDEVYRILSANLPLKQGEKETTSPEVKDRVDYTENTVLFLPNSNAKQSSIGFFIEGDDYHHATDPYQDAFNQYFSGGFSGLVLQEIREFRAMAYHADGHIYRPPVENKKDFFLGYVGTQADKTTDAIAVYMDLLTNMPKYPDRLTTIKSFLKGTASVEKPQFRSITQQYAAWKRRGYTQSPAETNAAAIDQLTFDDIVRYYDQHIKGRPIVIAVVGNPKKIDEKTLAQYGKVVKLSTGKIFK